MSLNFKFFNFIKRAVISNPQVQDLVNDPRAQIKYNGNTANIYVQWPYGMEGRLPIDTVILSLSVLGHEENKTGIGYTPNDPKEPFKPGEVAFGNPVSRTFITVLANGDIIIKNRDGTKPTVTIDGQLKVTGEITAFSGEAEEKSFTDIKDIYNSHTHDENDAAPGPTDAPNQLLP